MVLQALNETAYGEGLVVRGRHRALLCEDTEAACEEESRREAERMLLSPVMMLATHCSRNNNRWGSSPDCNLFGYFESSENYNNVTPACPPCPRFRRV